MVDSVRRCAESGYPCSGGALQGFTGRRECLSLGLERHGGVVLVIHPMRRNLMAASRKFSQRRGGAGAGRGGGGYEVRRSNATAREDRGALSQRFGGRAEVNVEREKRPQSPAPQALAEGGIRPARTSRYADACTWGNPGGLEVSRYRRIGSACVMFPRMLERDRKRCGLRSVKPPGTLGKGQQRKRFSCPALLCVSACNRS